jgi:hypothetical protein
MGRSDRGYIQTALMKNTFLNLFSCGVGVSGNMASTFRSLVKDEGEGIGKAAVVA